MAARILDFMHNETVISGYGFFMMGVVIVPMIGLAIWYHLRINNTEGGRRLMGEHNEQQARMQGQAQDLVGAFRMIKGINRGAYGEEVQKIYKIMWRVLAYWLLAIAIVGGIPLLLNFLLAPV